MIDNNKGNATVVMERSDYRAKFQGLLDDTETYTTSTNDPTIQVQTEMNDLSEFYRCVSHNVYTSKDIHGRHSDETR